MTYTIIDTFYKTDEELQKSPSRDEGVDVATETALRIYGCELIQESGILLRLSQAAMTTGQVLFHRFYCQRSFTEENVKMVAASCVWLASKLEECPINARHVLILFCKMECRREGLPMEHLDTSSKKYAHLKTNMIATEKEVLKAIGFVGHVEHPHRFIPNYLDVLETPPELRQEAWNLANDRFKSEVVACGVVYAAARKFQIPLPENPPWWEVFDADKSQIDEVCRVLAHLYSLPKARYVPVCKKAVSFTPSNRSLDLPSQPVSKESRKSNADSKSMYSKAEPASKSMNEHKTEASGERNKERKREREKITGREHHDEPVRARQREVTDKVKDTGHRSRDRGKDSGHSETSKHRSSQDRRYSSCCYSSREKDHRRHSSYA